MASSDSRTLTRGGTRSRTNVATSDCLRFAAARIESEIGVRDGNGRLSGYVSFYKQDCLPDVARREA